MIMQFARLGTNRGKWMASDKTGRRLAELMFENSLYFKRVLVRAAANEGLSPPQAALLWELSDNKSLSMRELAELLECDAANVTGLTAGLEERGLVLRSVSDIDRRLKLLSLTTEGKALRNRLAERLTAPPPWFSTLAKGEIELLVSIFSRASSTP